MLIARRHLPGPRFVFAILAVAAGVVLLAALHGIETYRAEKRAVLDPRQLPPVLDVADDGKPGQPTVYLIGDSQVAHWPLHGRTDWRLYRSGFAGQATPNIAEAVTPLLPRVKPDMVVIVSGGNDVAAITLLPSEAQSDAVERSVEAFRRLREAARQAGARLILVTLLPTDRKNGLLRSVLWGGQIKQVGDNMNHRLAAFCTGDCQTVDLRDALGIASDQDWSRYLSDGVHFNDAAYRRLGETFSTMAHGRSG